MIARYGPFLARWETLLLVFLAAAIALGGTASPYFLTASNISIAIAGAMPGAIVALAMTLVIVTGEIDISVGSITGLCAATIAIGLEHHLAIAPAVAAGFAVGTIAGLLNGVFVAYAGLPSLVVTIGTLALFRGIAYIVLEERGVSDFPDWYQNMGFGTVGPTPIPWSLLIFAPLFVVFAVFLHRTRWGRVLFAIGNNREAARFSGIDVRKNLLGVFAISGAMCSIAAVVLTAYLASARADTATGLELPVITAVVLGGVNIFGGSGTMGGVLIAVLVLAFVQNALGLAGMKPEEQQIVTGGVLVATLILFSAVGAVRARLGALSAPASPPLRGIHRGNES